MSPWENKSVVIVDDMDHVRSELEIMYQSLGLNVVGLAKDGIEALELVRNVKPDLVSLDIIMPEMDGIECYLRIKEMQPSPQVLFITYLANEPKFIESYRNRIPEELFLPKGVNENILRSRLNFLFGDGSLLTEVSSLPDQVNLSVTKQMSIDDPRLDIE